MARKQVRTLARILKIHGIVAWLRMVSRVFRPFSCVRCCFRQVMRDWDAEFDLEKRSPSLALDALVSRLALQFLLLSSRATGSCKTAVTVIEKKKTSTRRSARSPAPTMTSGRVSSRAHALSTDSIDMP